MKTIRDLIATAIELRNESVREVAERTGLNHSTLSRWLRGDQDLTVTKLEALLAYLNFRIIQK